MKLRRSELSTPGSSEKMIEKAAASAADFVFLDLEDAVAPSQKVAARDSVVRGLRELDWGKKLRGVRVNGAHTEWAHGDVIAVVEGAGENLDILVIPKVKAPRDVWFFDTLLSQLEKKLGLTNQIGLEVLIEETEALSRVEEIAGCSPRLEALTLGVGDLSASQGMRLGHIGMSTGGYPGDVWHFARTRLVVAARANGLDAIDGPFANFRDPDAYRKDAGWAATLGFAGKWAIHPSQIEIANEVFAPSDEEIATAKKMIEAYQQAERGGDGAKAVGGMMIDAATARIFENVIERARLADKLGREGS